MRTPLDTEAIFAQLGLVPILEAKPRLTKYRLEAAAALPEVIRRRITRFLATAEFDEAKEIPALDYEHVLELVSAAEEPGSTVTRDRGAALLAAVPDVDLATELAQMAERISSAANKLIPREPPNPVTLQPVDDPEPHATAEFSRFWQVACDPMTVLDDLEDGSLIDEQVTALGNAYPEIYASMRQAVTDAIATMVARRGKKWEPHPTKAALIATLKQIDDFDADLAAMMQASFAAEAAAQQAATPAPPKRAPRNSADEGLSAPTPGQRAAAS